jgi:hypothetical protein
MLEKAGKVRSGSKTKTRVRVVEDGRARVKSDHLATEEPMEIRLVTGGRGRPSPSRCAPRGLTSSSRPGSFTGRASSPPAMR